MFFCIKGIRENNAVKYNLTQKKQDEGCLCRSFRISAVRLNSVGAKKSRRTRWTSHIARMALMRNPYKIWVCKLGWKRLFGTRSLKWENGELDRQKCGGVGVNWMRLAQVRVQWRASMRTLMEQV
jgi:hypothetical protein